MRRQAWIAAAWLLAALPLPSQAQTAPPITDWSNVETVTVTAGTAGPALWHVTSKTGQLWLLGTVFPVPKDFTWDHHRLDSILHGARKVYLPPRLQAGFFEASWFLLTKRHTLYQRDGVTLEQTLTPELRARLAAVRKRLDKDDDSDLLGAVAALDFEQSFHDAAKLDGRPIERVIADMADDADVSAVPIAEYDAMPALEQITKLPQATQTACIADALDDIEAQSAHAAAAAKAWAVGDLAGIKANYSEMKLLDCLQQSKLGASYRAGVIAAAMKSANEALAAGGTSLLVISMGELLRQGGVIDRLTAEGYTVNAPGD